MLHAYAQVSLRAADRGLILNKTNALSLVDITGSDDSDEWVGQRVEIYATRVPFQGKMVNALRLRRPAKKGNAALDEDTPF